MVVIYNTVAFFRAQKKPQKTNNNEQMFHLFHNNLNLINVLKSFIFQQIKSFEKHPLIC